MKNKIKKIFYLLLAGFAISYWAIASVLANNQIPERDINLIWSTDTYVAPDYPGKPLPTRGSSIEIVAQIDSSRIEKDKLIYKWFLNEYIQKESSGLGKQVFKFNIGNSIQKEHSIKLEIQDSRGNDLGSSPYLYIQAVEPEISLKTQAPKIKSGQKQKYQILPHQEISFVANPYFFNIKSLDELEYKWDFVGGEISQNGSNNQHILTFETGEIGEAIERELSLQIENKNNSIQAARYVADINFIP